MINRLEKIDYKIPGVSVEKISGLSLVVTEEHHHVFPFWNSSKIKGATLIHVDSHSDLADDKVPSLNVAFEEYYKNLQVGTFICPAVHYGFIKELFWINPTNILKETHIQYLEKDRLVTEIDGFGDIKWKNSPENYPGYIKTGKIGNCITLKELIKKLNNPWILDVDLDAFATISYLLGIYNPVSFEAGWKEKVDKTLKLLKKLPRPDLITITRSQGERPFISPDVVDVVQKRFLEKLGRLY